MFKFSDGAEKRQAMSIGAELTYSACVTCGGLQHGVLSLLRNEINSGPTCWSHMLVAHVGQNASYCVPNSWSIRFMYFCQNGCVS